VTGFCRLGLDLDSYYNARLVAYMVLYEYPLGRVDKKIVLYASNIGTPPHRREVASMMYAARKCICIAETRSRLSEDLLPRLVNALAKA